MAVMCDWMCLWLYSTSKNKMFDAVSDKTRLLHDDCPSKGTLNLAAWYIQAGAKICGRSDCSQKMCSYPSFTAMLY